MQTIILKTIKTKIIYSAKLQKEEAQCQSQTLVINGRPEWQEDRLM